MQTLAAIQLQAEGLPAIDFEGDVRSYGSLRAAAVVVAAELTGRGIRAGDRVAVFLPHGPDAPAVLLGIWIVGAVAVPLDGGLPVDRMRRIVERSGATVLFAGGRRGAALARRLGGGWPARTIVEVPPGGGSAGGSSGTGGPTGRAPSPTGELPASEPALLLYTSGSTGEPKGVTITRGNVDVFAAHWRERLGIRPGHRVAWVASLAFDLSLLDLWATLGAGATVVPVPEGKLAFPQELVGWLRERDIGTWYSVPSLSVAMLREGLVDPVPPPRLRNLLYAGERMEAGDALALRRALPGVRIVNLFGPTETNVSCAFELPADWAGGEVPIGEPCPYLDVVVLDDRGAPAPIGTPGELVAAGGTVMAGYWEEPERARWVDVDGRRYLRTGDRVVRQPDGALVFLGRVDRMLKIRGYRVEPQDVEIALAAHDGVAEAAVVGVTSADGVELVAFVAPSGGGLGQAGAELGDLLEAHLAARLPRWAVPSRFVLVDALPRTARGKVDLVALERVAAGYADLVHW